MTMKGEYRCKRQKEDRDVTWAFDSSDSEDIQIFKIRRRNY